MIRKQRLLWNHRPVSWCIILARLASRHWRSPSTLWSQWQTSQVSSYHVWCRTPHQRTWSCVTSPRMAGQSPSVFDSPVVPLQIAQLMSASNDTSLVRTSWWQQHTAWHRFLTCMTWHVTQWVQRVRRNPIAQHSPKVWLDQDKGETAHFILWSKSVVWIVVLWHDRHYIVLVKVSVLGKPLKPEVKAIGFLWPPSCPGQTFCWQDFCWSSCRQGGAIFFTLRPQTYQYT